MSNGNRSRVSWPSVAAERSASAPRASRVASAGCRRKSRSASPSSGYGARSWTNASQSAVYGMAATCASLSACSSKRPCRKSVPKVAGGRRSPSVCQRVQMARYRLPSNDTWCEFSRRSSSERANSGAAASGSSGRRAREMPRCAPHGCARPRHARRPRRRGRAPAACGTSWSRRSATSRCLSRARAPRARRMWPRACGQRARGKRPR